MEQVEGGGGLCGAVRSDFSRPFRTGWSQGHGVVVRYKRPLYWSW